MRRLRALRSVDDRTTASAPAGSVVAAERPVPEIAQRVVPDGISPYIVLDEVGTVLWSSAALTSLLGWTADEFAGHNFLEFLHPDCHHDTIDSFAGMLDWADDMHGWVGPRLTIEALTKAGDRIPMEVSATLADELYAPDEMHRADGAMVCHLMLARGIPTLFDAVAELAHGGPVDAVLARLAQAVRQELPDSAIELSWEWDGMRFGRTVSTDDPPDAGGHLTAQTFDGPTPWERAVDRGWLEGGHDFADWDRVLAARAHAAGWATAWSLPIVGDDARPTGALTIWRHVPGRPLRFMLTPAERVCQLASIAIRSESEQRSLRRAATTDPLTGLPNRAEIERRIQEAMDDPNSPGPAVLFCDVDGFKPINDDLGHDVGDAVLIEIAARLRDTSRGDDLVGRWGGDEFVAVVAAADPAVVQRVAERAVAELAAPIELNGRQLAIGISVGASVYHADDIDPSTLLRRADDALRGAKQAGKGRVYFAP